MDGLRFNRYTLTGVRLSAFLTGCGGSHYTLNIAPSLSCRTSRTCRVVDAAGSEEDSLLSATTWGGMCDGKNHSAHFSRPC
jgi:hypothetical protein